MLLIISLKIVRYMNRVRSFAYAHLGGKFKRSSRLSKMVSFASVQAKNLGPFCGCGLWSCIRMEEHELILVL
jgi:hypothetical protein